MEDFIDKQYKNVWKKQKNRFRQNIGQKLINFEPDCVRQNFKNYKFTKPEKFIKQNLQTTKIFSTQKIFNKIYKV